ncbi:MAG: proprotein convertase P-domain-containing protein [Flavobacterium sp.]|nr:proprotein convertase P-domain-containing protein [Flavobacterium sp.]
MKKNLLLLLILFSCFQFSFSQNSWRAVTLENVRAIEKMDKTSMPAKYLLFQTDLNALKQQILNAPKDLNNVESTVIVSFPNASGQIEHFKVYNSPMMEEELAQKYPEIKTYSGIGVEDKTASIRFSITPFGLHMMKLSGNADTMLMDTFTKDLNTFIVYEKKEAIKSKSFECLTGDKSLEKGSSSKSNSTASPLNSDSKFRIYRLAIAATGEYTAFFGGTKPQALAAIVVTVNRVNLLYERDLSVRLVLVNNTDLVIYTNAATDPFDNNNAGTLIGQSEATISSIIGNQNFDIGHTVSTGGGGLAGVGVVCVDGNKASGITGSAAPVGDAYDIDYVAHEMGHQFGGNHTFNGSIGSCSGNRNDPTAVEPGSGTTIMAYAGICGSQDIQPHSDDHFSAISIGEIESNIIATATCANIILSGNIPPVVNAGLDYTIPKSTPFILKGNATDANNASLTYCWEQTNFEVSTQPPVQTAPNGPNFRSRSPISSPNRYMPVLQSVINNVIAPAWEVVPSVARTLNFALTVRDNQTSNGGQTGRDDMVVTVANVGPFLVNTPNTNVSWVAGSNQTVTWTVAGTTGNGINATYVDILLSTDGGFTYPILLASQVPNDGSETITVPNNVGSTNRIMVRGYNHIFYDISNTNFTITTAPSTFAIAFSGIEGGQNKNACQGSTVTYPINYTALTGYAGTTTFGASGNPAGSTVVFTPSTAVASGAILMTVTTTNSTPVGLANIIVTATSGAITKAVPFYLNLFSSNFAPMTLLSPANNADLQQTFLTLSWASNANATSYDVQIATDINFTNIISSGNVTSTSYNVSNLAVFTDYYWRVLPKNVSCSGSYSSPYKFTTGDTLCNSNSSTNVPIPISASGTSTVTSTISIPFAGSISDVNVSLNIAHSYVGDITASLTSPAGTSIQLFDGQCAGNNNVNATFDDSGTNLVCGTNPAISGIIIPLQSLSAFNNENPSGIWTLAVTDNFDGDGGAINGWSLDICALQDLAVNAYGFDNFILFPNPNNGTFTIKFNSNASENISITVNDIRGREIYNQKFFNNGNFNQSINLDQIESGVYLVSISSDDKGKLTKRIIIK